MPQSILDETTNLATWNIREFGRRPRLPKSLHYIAELIGRFDLVALTEVRRDLSDLLRVMERLPPLWDFVERDYGSDRAANKELVAYVLDKRVVGFTGLAAEADPPRKRNKQGRCAPSFTWWRAAYIASFRSGNFDLAVVTVHLRWGSGEEERVVPMKELATWARKRSRDERGFDRDLLVVWGMNIPSRDSELFRAARRHGLKLPGRLAELRESEATANLPRKAVYDQILHHATDPARFTDNAGAVDFYMGDHRGLYPEIDLLRDFTCQMSDHLPLWIQLDTRIEHEQLDSMLERLSEEARDALVGAHQGSQ